MLAADRDFMLRTRDWSCSVVLIRFRRDSSVSIAGLLVYFSFQIPDHLACQRDNAATNLIIEWQTFIEALMKFRHFAAETQSHGALYLSCGINVHAVHCAAGNGEQGGDLIGNRQPFVLALLEHFAHPPAAFDARLGFCI
jgi:hypothetical protein